MTLAHAWFFFEIMVSKAVTVHPLFHCFLFQQGSAVCVQKIILRIMLFTLRSLRLHALDLQLSKVPNY